MRTKTLTTIFHLKLLISNPFSSSITRILLIENQLLKILSLILNNEQELPHIPHFSWRNSKRMFAE